MKLNNRGWSLNTLITLIVVILLAVILVSILAYNFGKDKDFISMISVGVYYEN